MKMLTSYKISKISIHNYRSIKNLVLAIPKDDSPIIICGSNNVGKTNYLRAINLFFNENDFKAINDIPYEIVEATRGAGYKTTITLEFSDSLAKEKVLIKKVFKEESGENIIIKTGYKKISNRKTNLSEMEINKFIESFHYIFLESSNVNIPVLVSQITKNNVLSDLDKLRGKQTKPLNILKCFITESEKSLQGIEKSISKDFKEFAEGVNTFNQGLDIGDWSVKFVFPRYELLREAIGTMVNFILQDSNQKELEAKGSGIQRILFLTLIKYISEHSKKSIIWGIDEPEVFLQPGLQKKVFEIIKGLSRNFKIFITTHSHHFVDLNNLDSVFLFNAEYKKQAYRRKKDKEYIKISTQVDKSTGYNKVQKVKDHLGISANDSWEIMPYNLVVEGEEDKQYISTLLKVNNLDSPKILVADGADKFIGYLLFVNLFCDEKNIKPKLLSILDFDQKGKDVHNKLTSGKRNYIFEHKVEYMQRFDNQTNNSWEYEIEDFIYPDILFKGVNKILAKKKYAVLKINSLLKKKAQASFQKDSVLKFITNEIKNENQDKQELNFEEIELKKYLCTVVCEILSREKDIDGLNKKYPKIREYLNKITTPFA